MSRSSTRRSRDRVTVRHAASPYRLEAEAPEPPPSAPYSAQFVTRILDNLRRAGVQNTKRNERLEFSRLDPYPGVYIHATGEYPENGHVRTAAVASGGEHAEIDEDAEAQIDLPQLRSVMLAQGRPGRPSWSGKSMPRPTWFAIATTAPTATRR